jgi:Leucine-rich repeat (LRR) protein
MKRAYTLGLIMILCLLAKPVTGQSVVIPDAAFRSYLVSNHPGLMNGSQQLIISAANAYTGSLSLSNLSISDLSGIQYFTSCHDIDCSNNNLTSLPDLSPLVALQTLTCNDNSLSSITGLSNLTALRFLTCGNNQITSFPDLSALTQLEVLNAPDNQLTTIPGLANLTSLRHLYVYNNSITSLENVSGLVNLTEFVCKNNQLSALPALTGLGNLVELDCSVNPLVSLPVMSGLTSLQRLFAYSCQLTSLPSLAAFTQLVTLDVNNNQLSTLPDFSSNSNLVNLKVQLNQLSFEDLEPLVVHPSFLSFTIAPQDSLGVFQSIQGDELKPVTLSLGIDETITTNLYVWSKDSKTIANTFQNSLRFAYAQEYQEGDYYCTISSTLPALVGITLKMRPIKLRVQSCRETGAECHPVITPDGDGINDSYFVPDSGAVKVFSKNGNMVTEFSSPGSWDGSDKSGSLVTMGVYLLVLSSGETVSVTVIK